MSCGYCEEDIDETLKLLPLECQKCKGLYHVSCLRSQKPKECLLGDQLFQFVCAHCSPTGEDLQRPHLQWVCITHLALYNLMLSGEGRKGYFRWNDDICSFIEARWAELMPYRRKTHSWHSTVAGTLSVHCPAVFQSGFTEFGEHGWWTLTQLTPPTLRLATGLDTRLIVKRQSNSGSESTPTPKRAKTNPSESTTNRRTLERPLITAASPGGRLTERQEGVLLDHLSRYQRAISLNPKACRLVRKLKVRQSQRSYETKLFDIDEEIAKMLANTCKYVLDECQPFYEQAVALHSSNATPSVSSKPTPTLAKSVQEKSILDRFSTSLSSKLPVLSGGLPVLNSRFEHHLYGSGVDTDCFTSPFTTRTLKPFIFRSSEFKTRRTQLLGEIVHKYNKTHAEATLSYTPKSIDFCYLREHHLPAVNCLVSHFFWSVDISECLQFPDCTVVVLYGKLVIGCGSMTPDVKVNEAYISFLVVHPDFQRAGIAKIMLYHLIQSCMCKDVTLHVSVDNTAMMLYQYFGFKAERYCLDFYDKYYPESHYLSKHAYFMRLKR